MARPAKAKQTPPGSFSAAEKRVLELRIESLKADLEATQQALDTQRTERIRAETCEREVRKELEKERQDGNLLRTAVHELEIDYAKLRGYIDGQHDSEPPRMVPDTRESRLASYPDGSMRFRVATPYSSEANRNWYERR